MIKLSITQAYGGVNTGKRSFVSSGINMIIQENTPKFFMHDCAMSASFDHACMGLGFRGGLYHSSHGSAVLHGLISSFAAGLRQ